MTTTSAPIPAHPGAGRGQTQALPAGKALAPELLAFITALARHQAAKDYAAAHTPPR